MNMNMGSGSASILMRRVRRHARLATLWQPPEAPQAGVEEPMLPSLGKASPMADSPQAPLLARSHSQVIARWPAPEHAAPFAAHQQAQPLEQLARSSPALPPTEPVALAPVQRQAAQLEASPTEHLSASNAPEGEKQPEKEESAAEQTSWLRLRAIMRAHREKQAQGTVASAASGSQAGEAPASSLVREVAKKPPPAASLPSTEKPASATMHRAPSEPLHTHIIETVAQRVEADEILSQPQTDAGLVPVFDSHPGEPVAAPKRPDAAQPSPVSDQEEHNAPPSASRSSLKDLATPGPVAAHLTVPATSSAAAAQLAEPPAQADLVTQEQPVHPSVDDMVDEEGPVELHSVSLETAWPVQRRVASSDAALRPTLMDNEEPAESDADTATNGPDKMEKAPGQAGEKQTSGASEPTAPDGMRTQSARATLAIDRSRADMVPETVPEPGTLNRLEAEAPVQATAQPQVVARSETELQLQADGALVTTALQSEDEALPPNDPRPAVVQPAPSSPQEQVVDKAPSPVSTQPEIPPSAKPHMITTEIGPLPADLWELVDEAPPNTSEARLSAGQGNISGETFLGWVERQSDSEDDQPALQAGLGEAMRPVIQADEPASDIVQMARLPLEMEYEEGQPAVESASQPPVGEGKAAQPEQADLAGLVQQVYAEIRRRLALEWERSRR